MTKAYRTTCSVGRTGRPAVVLVLTLIVLTVLAVVTAGLSVKVTQVKRRQQYRIDYLQARYACDSAMKYMLTVLPEKNFTPKSREGLPDFSDLFWMTEDNCLQYISYWLQTAEEDKIKKVLKEPLEEAEPVELPANSAEMWAKVVEMITAGMKSDPNESADAYAGSEETLRDVDPNRIEIPGPYGVAWPYVIEPIELEIGAARVRITVEDENAKLPLGWGMLPDEAAEAAVVTFCEMMRMTPGEIEALFVQLEAIREKKPYTQDPQPILQKARVAAAGQARANQFQTTRGTAAAASARTRAQQQPQPQQQQAQDVLRPAIANAADFSKLFHSSLVDHEFLRRPLPNTGQRAESPLLYLGLWGAQEVNINTAPRHVLEAAFTFGGHEVEIADEIIRRRQEKPYKNIKELTDELTVYKVEIDKASKYITTQSAFFKVRVECTSGIARCAAVATVFKDRKNVQKLAILYSR